VTVATFPSRAPTRFGRLIVASDPFNSKVTSSPRRNAWVVPGASIVGPQPYLELGSWSDVVGRKHVDANRLS